MKWSGVENNEEPRSNHGEGPKSPYFKEVVVGSTQLPSVINLVFFLTNFFPFASYSFLAFVCIFSVIDKCGNIKQKLKKMNKEKLNSRH